MPRWYTECQLATGRRSSTALKEATVRMRFARLAQFFEELEVTSSRKALIQILARLFGEVDDTEIDRAVYLCQGRLAPFFEPLEIGMGEKLVADGIALATETSRAEVLARYEKLGDLGLVAAERADAAGRVADPEGGPTIVEVYDCLRSIATSTGSGTVERKLALLSELLSQVDPPSAKHLARIPLGRLRLGIGDPTLLDAFSVARVGDTSLRKTLERAYNETSDLGLIATTLWRDGVDAVRAIQIQLGKPIRPALAERLPSAAAIVAKLGLCAAEPKLDGFRCQVHKDGDRVIIFSRNLENMTEMFPEIAEGTRAQVRAERAIFEGEAVAYNPESEEYLPFQETTRRRRKHQVAEMALELPLRLFVFDVMYVDGENVAPLPYLERRERLRALVAPGDTLEVTPSITTDEPTVLQSFVLENVQKGLEGIVAKKLDSPYQAGARNFNWVKLKRVQAGHLSDTVDCVILGYVFGRGKRAAFGAGALLVGVYDAERDVFETITKIGTGLSDAEWREIRLRCDEITVAERPARVDSVLVPSVWVEPRVVIEVLADEITRSPVHTAGRRNGEPGYALRFPRLITFRGDDKRPEDATTVAEVVDMYSQQAALRSRSTSSENAEVGEAAPQPELL